jgi:hypothetical protein
VTAARMVARLAGPLPAEVSSAKVTSRTWWCASMDQCSRTSQVQGFRELGEVAGLVVLDAGLEVIRQPAAVLGGAGQVDPGAVGAAGPATGLAVYGHGP